MMSKLNYCPEAVVMDNLIKDMQTISNVMTHAQRAVNDNLSLNLTVS